MSLYIRLLTNFWTHRKTAKLRSLIGNDALWILPRLWSYAAENQPDGDFTKYSPEEIALLIGYQGDAQAMLQALQQALFMNGMQLHDWEEHNGYHHTFSERAKKAAKARWDKKGNEMIGKEKKGDKQCFKHDVSINEPKNGYKKRLNALYGRRETTAWSVKEERTFSELLKHSEFESELAEIERFYLSGYKYRRQDIQTLLNNWSGELDRARNNSKPQIKLRTFSDMEVES